MREEGKGREGLRKEEGLAPFETKYSLRRVLKEFFSVMDMHMHNLGG